MTAAVPRMYWPYDEVSAARDPKSQSAFFLIAPWLKIRLDLPQAQLSRAIPFLEKLAANSLTAEDIDDVNWFFASLSDYPLAYVLPRPQIDGGDQHRILASTLNLASPAELLQSLTASSKEPAAIKMVTEARLPKSWSWDIEAAEEFSKFQDLFDPQSLFSVARRFHLLNDLESNRTGEMLTYVQSLKADSEKFRKASALVLRQNHYITEQCESVLREALAIGRNANEEILAFIQAESGHDGILAKALRSLGADPVQTQVTPVAKTLMEVFRFSARRNLLAFAMIVDIFERTSYREEDPVTSMLKSGGEAAAGRQIDIHRDINDSGGHENVALEFLNSMAPADEAYAREAMLLAELTTLVIHQLSAETLDILRADDSASQA